MVNDAVKTTKDLGSYTNEELLELYRENQHLEIKQEIALRYLYIVKSIALQMRNVYIGFEQVDDIINEGVIMLMRAIDKYDPSLNVKFETYISKRARGMVIDIARKQDWVPRTTRRTYKEINDLSTNFYSENGREPTPSEICDTLGMERSKYDDIMRKSSLFNILSLDMAIEETGEFKKNLQVPSEDMAEQPEESFLNKELKEILAQGIKLLKEKEQIVISLYYIEEISMKEIAKVMSVSEPRVSQIHAGAIRKLHNYIKTGSIS